MAYKALHNKQIERAERAARVVSLRPSGSGGRL